MALVPDPPGRARGAALTREQVYPSRRAPPSRYERDGGHESRGRGYLRFRQPSPLGLHSVATAPAPGRSGGTGFPMIVQLT